MIKRFINRLSLPNNYNCQVLSLYENNNQHLRNQFSQKIKEHGLLELYHSSRGDQFGASKSILEQGFKIRHGDGNKGNGVYLANHSRYAWLWGGPYVIVSDVIAQSSSIQRFKSEIASGSNLHDSEYLIKDPTLIYPKSIIEFKVTTKSDTNAIDLYDFPRFVEYGQFGCSLCDPKKIRCDCQQYPTIDGNDLLTPTKICLHSDDETNYSVIEKCQQEKCQLKNWLSPNNVEKKSNHCYAMTNLDDEEISLVSTTR